MAKINIKFNNKNYSIDPASLADATASLEGHLAAMMDEPAGVKAGLYKTGSNYTELITSWDNLISSGAIKVIDGAVSVGMVLPDNLPEKNEYGFYYGVTYVFEGMGVIFYEDGSIDVYEEGAVESAPAGTIVYGNGTIDMSILNMGVGTISSGGLSIVFTDIGVSFMLGEIPQLAGDLILPDDGSITTITMNAFARQSLTGVIIPASITSINRYAFSDCTSLITINYRGTVDLWDTIDLGESGGFYDWNHNVPATHVHCSDGDVAL